MVKRKSNIVVGSSGLIKSINKKNVLNTIKRSEMISRAEISREVKLTMPTVMRISEELIQDGLVCEVGKGVSTGGRKPNLLSIVPCYPEKHTKHCCEYVRRHSLVLSARYRLFGRRR